MISKTNLQIDEQILKTDRVICRHISNMSNLSRGEIRKIFLLNFAISGAYYAKSLCYGADIEDSHENIQKAVKYVKTRVLCAICRAFITFASLSVTSYFKRRKF